MCVCVCVNDNNNGESFLFYFVMRVFFLSRESGFVFGIWREILIISEDDTRAFFLFWLVGIERKTKKKRRRDRAFLFPHISHTSLRQHTSTKHHVCCYSTNRVRRRPQGHQGPSTSLRIAAQRGRFRKILPTAFFFEPNSMMNISRVVSFFERDILLPSVRGRDDGTKE